MSGSIWDNVAFDHTAANEAIGALERAATQLDQASKDRAAQAQHAREDWSGATRVEFDQAVDPALRQAGDLVAALRRAAGTIRSAATGATAEQERRLKVRDEHRARGGMRPV
ncbi:MAG: hypothetical protein ACRDYX_05505 [Egibacteraceae bacterium]